MNCPRTNSALQTARIGSVEAHVSTGCGGIWFPGFQLKKSESLNPEQRMKLIELSRTHRAEDLDTTARLRCPVDDGVVLMRRFFSFKREIEIDECGRCGGVWLDPGEFEKILNLYHSPEALAQKARRQQSSKVIKQLGDDSRRQKEKDRMEALQRQNCGRHGTDTSLLWVLAGGMVDDF